MCYGHGSRLIATHRFQFVLGAFSNRDIAPLKRPKVAEVIRVNQIRPASIRRSGDDVLTHVCVCVIAQFQVTTTFFLFRYYGTDLAHGHGGP